MKLSVKQIVFVSLYILVGSWIIYTFVRVKKAEEIVFSIGAGTEEIKLIKELIHEFEYQNPPVRVTLNILPAPTDQQHHYYLTTLGAKATDIDVVRIDTIWIAEFAAAGWLEPLGDYLPAEDATAFIPITDETNRYQGNLYAIPWNANIGLLYYRKDIVNKYNVPPPDTWEDLVDICMKATGSEAMHGYLWQGKQYEGLVCNFIEFIGSNGGEIINNDGDVVVNSFQNEKALNLMHDMIWKYRISPPNTPSELMEESSRHLFQQGKGLFLRNWTYVWDICQRDSTMRSKVGVTRLPKFSGKNSTSVYAGWHLAMSACSKKKGLAWRLINFLTSSHAQKELALHLSWAPTRISLYKYPVLLQKLPFLEIIEESLKDIQIRPNLPYYQWISDVIQKHVNKVLSNQTNSKQALQTIQTELERIKNEFTQN